jgi:hypothetical protein
MNARLFGAALAGMIGACCRAAAADCRQQPTPVDAVSHAVSQIPRQVGRMTTSAATVLGGLDLFLLGIHHLTEGPKAVAGDSLRRVMQTLVGGRLSAVVSGDLFTVVLQSSTATTLTVIGFVSAGWSSLAPQAVGVIVGTTFGTISYTSFSHGVDAAVDPKR